MVTYEQGQGIVPNFSELIKQCRLVGAVRYGILANSGNQKLANDLSTSVGQNLAGKNDHFSFSSHKYIYTDPLTNISYDFSFNWNSITCFFKKVAIAVGEYLPQALSTIVTAIAQPEFAVVKTIANVVTDAISVRDQMGQTYAKMKTIGRDRNTAKVYDSHIDQPLTVQPLTIKDENR